MTTLLLVIVILISAAAVFAVIYFSLFRYQIPYTSKNDTIYKMEFSDDGDFRILHLTDLHLFFPIFDIATLRLVKKAVLKYTPDLVVVTGDLSLSPFNLLCYKSFSRLMKKLGCQYSLCFGNLDGHFGFHMNWLCRHLEKDDNAIFASAHGVTGKGNHCITICHSDFNKFNLYFLDSGSYSYLKSKVLRDDDYIKQDQLNWLEYTQASLHYPPFAVFCHIPPAQMAEACETDHSGTLGCRPYVARNGSIFLKRLSETRGARAVFFGHDHKNDCSALWRGILLAYGRIGGYIAHKTGGIKRGVRIIDLSEFGKKLSTHIVISSEM